MGMIREAERKLMSYVWELLVNGDGHYPQRSGCPAPRKFEFKDMILPMRLLGYEPGGWFFDPKVGIWITRLKLEARICVLV